LRVVIDIATETDIERLRQVAQLLESENDRLHRRLKELTTRLATAEGSQAESLQLEIRLLQEQLAHQRRVRFGQSSEKKKPATKSEDAKPREARRGHGPTEQPSLPVVEVLHQLDEADEICPSCGGELAEMKGQFEEADEIDVVERAFRIVRHKRQKYRCRCGGCVDTALGPPKLIPGGRYSVGFAAAVAIGKYIDHLPLARQVKQMRRAGLSVTSQTLWDQLEALARHLTPSYEALAGRVLEAPVVGADETRWRLLTPGKSKTWWAWSVTAPEAVFYRIASSRSAAAATELLGGYSGVVMCDGYRAYHALARERDGPGGFVLAHCWSHARRKFVEAEPDYPKAGEVLALIGELYALEAEAGDDPARRAEIRQTRSREIVARIHDWVLTQRILPESSLGKAIQYMGGIWEGLCRFLEDPAIPLDNNATERAMRGVALGRKNHHGSRSRRGTEVAALFYSLVETAKLVGIDPALYLREAARRAILNPRTVMLPRDLLEG
jgi:transposase